MKPKSNKKQKSPGGVIYHLKPGQTKEEAEAEIKALYGDRINISDAPMNASSQDLAEMMRQSGMSDKEIEDMLSGGKSESKTGVVQKIKNALFD